MIKIAIIELGMMQIRLSVLDIAQEQYFEIRHEYSEFINLDQHIKENNGIIKQSKINEVIEIIDMFKMVARSKGAERCHCYASAQLSSCKNAKSIMNEINKAVSLEFQRMTVAEEMSALHLSIINTLEVGKGLIVAVSASTTTLISFSRRIILGSAVIPIGAGNWTTEKEFFNELKKVDDSIKFMDSETKIIGSGTIFRSFARLSRKKKKYPVAINHGYEANQNDFEDISKFLKELNMDRDARLKGISHASVGFLIDGMEIVKMIMNWTNLSNIIINDKSRATGLGFNLVLPITNTSPVDVFNYSVDKTLWANGLDSKSAWSHLSIATSLWKQLRIVHRLDRKYMKVLKTATLFYNFGRKINSSCYEPVNYYALLFSGLNGLSNNELVLAAFVASCKNWEYFSLAEWVKYKDILDTKDLDVVRKLALVAAMSEAINIRVNDDIEDIICDILGDSVIIKLVIDKDVKNFDIDITKTKIEIFYAKKFAKEFEKVFGRKVEIL
ncbi:MAG: hypothetical protein LBH47_03135 [Christensenellaceae bacterium]|jgi:exopolyphosphatase/guanosine-5'-triphosphate,3'-diphosphate pyrophosphatase|nr:hypothetical protein [Christensenellaceae bacterium]